MKEIICGDVLANRESAGPVTPLGDSPSVVGQGPDLSACPSAVVGNSIEPQLPLPTLVYFKDLFAFGDDGQGVEEELNWVPRGPAEIVGNREARAAIYQLLSEWHHQQPLCITGPDRSGKTACILAAIQALSCPNAKTSDWMACRACTTCHLTINALCEAIHVDDGSDESPLFYQWIDCTDISVERIQALEHGLSRPHETQVVILDNVHGLEVKGLEKRLLKLVSDRKKDTHWFASTEHADLLGPEFRNAFKVVSTSAPSAEELFHFLIRMCEGFHLEYDHDSTLTRMVEIYNDRPGCCVIMLTCVAYARRRFTNKMLDGFMCGVLSVD